MNDNFIENRDVIKVNKTRIMGIPIDKIDYKYLLKKQMDIGIKAKEANNRIKAQIYIVEEINRAKIVPEGFDAVRSDNGIKICYKDASGKDCYFEDEEVVLDFMNEVVESILANGYPKAWAKIYVNTYYLGYHVSCGVTDDEVNNTLMEIASMLEMKSVKGISG